MKGDFVAIIKEKSRDALTECRTTDFTKCFARWHDRWARSEAPGRQWSWQHWSEYKCCSHGEIKWVRKLLDRTTYVRPIYCSVRRHEAAACNGCPQMHLLRRTVMFPEFWVVCQQLALTHTPMRNNWSLPLLAKPQDSHIHIWDKNTCGFTP